MPSGNYTRTRTQYKKISNKLKGKKRPRVRKIYENKKKDKEPYDGSTKHGEIINRGKKSYKEYIKEKIKKDPSQFKNTSLRNIRWFEGS